MQESEILIKIARKLLFIFGHTLYHINKHPSE